VNNKAVATDIAAVTPVQSQIATKSVTEPAVDTTAAKVEAKPATVAVKPAKIEIKPATTETAAKVDTKAADAAKPTDTPIKTPVSDAGKPAATVVASDASKSGETAAKSDNTTNMTAEAGPSDTGAKVIEQAPLKPSEGSVIIRRGDTLWQISRRVYGLGVRYTTIYLANKTQIQDPDEIMPGQIFSVPDKPLPNAEELHRKRLGLDK
jgi:nucleoid-associated protein YgaU